MNALEQPTTDITVEDLSRGILDCAKEGDIEGLTGLVTRLKALAPRNVYVVAVEKQAAKLTAPDMTPEHRTELLKAFPVLMERAVAEFRRMAAMPARPDPNEERREAMEKMKRQYFERADAFVDRGEFQRALEEVRRVLILDKTNALALEYEQKIKTLTDAAAPPPAPQVESAPAPAPAPEAAPARAMTGGRRRLIAIVAAVLLVVGSAAGYFVFRGHSGQGTENAASVAQISATIAAPAANQAASTNPPGQPAATTAPAPRVEVKAPASTEPAPKPASAAPKDAAPASTTPSSSASQSATQTPAAAPVQAPAAAAPAQDLPPPPTPFVASETGVEVVRIPALNYPDVAMRNHIEGRVVVEVTVNGSGKPIETRVLKSDSELLDDAAIEAAMNATYKPATMNDAPVMSKVAIPFNFRLKK